MGHIGMTLFAISSWFILIGIIVLVVGAFYKPAVKIGSYILVSSLVLMLASFALCTAGNTSIFDR